VRVWRALSAVSAVVRGAGHRIAERGWGGFGGVRAGVRGGEKNDAIGMME